MWNRRTTTPRTAGARLRPRTIGTLATVAALVVTTVVATTSTAANDAPPPGVEPLLHPGLDVRTELVRGDRSHRRSALTELLVPTESAFLDLSTGRWATLLPAAPLIPGDGVGNRVTWRDLGRDAPLDDAGVAAAAELAFRRYLATHSEALAIEPSELAPSLDVAVHGETILIHARRAVDGVPVRDSFVTATISHGNLILFGTARWADVSIATAPTIDRPEARAVVGRYLDLTPTESSPHRLRSWGQPELALVPFQVGDTLTYRLVHALKPRFADEHARWEALVDAHEGELLSLVDTRRAAARHVVGGVYPLTNDGDGDGGSEQPRWPMPFADLNGQRFADGSGGFPGNFDGEVTTTLTGRFVEITDDCGELSESSVGPNADIDLGVADGDNCNPPPGKSPGNTSAARTAYYQTNRLAAWARTRRPTNLWLNAPLSVLTNFNATCGGLWNGTSLNLFRGGNGCRNTGEIASIIAHEWGHGLDDNDNNGAISFPGEGIADVYSALFLNDSCVGKGFLESGSNCNGYGDPCTDCAGGIRDVDWRKHASGEPHDVAWADATCGGCGQFGVRQCLGAVTAETIWDLARDDLPAAGFNAGAALELTTWLTLIGAGNVGDWYTCNGDGEDGCAAEGGYLNYLAADDVDGTLANGTPRMSAIFDAFDRHGIACSTPAVQDRGCEAAPTEAPDVTATAGDSAVTLSWDPVPGAERYFVFRAEGLRQCSQGKAFVGSTAGTGFTDDDLLPGFEYHYSVTARAGGRSCIGPMSSCTSVEPR